MSKEKEKILNYQAVLYSDGSARPTNPGYMGWSVHGYVFSDKTTSKGAGHPKVAPTDVGYVTKDTKPAPIDLVNYYDYMGWSGTVGTNNAAEVSSIASALKYATTIENLTNVTVYCDNKYAVNGASQFLLGWVANGWKKRDGADVQNQEEWKAVLSNMNILADKKTKVKIEWVKGHADNFGNIQADGLATIAGQRSMLDQTKSEIERITPSTGYWAADAIRHPMLGLRGMLFFTDKAKNKPGEYYLVNQTKSHEFIGRNEVGCSYGYVLTTNPDPLVEVVRKRQIEESRDFSTLVLARLDRVYDKAVCAALNRYGDCVLRRVSSHHLNMHFLNERAMVQPSKKELEEEGGSASLPITEELFPVRLALRPIEVISMLKGLVETFKTTPGHDPEYEDGKVFEITDKYYEETTDKHGVVAKTFRKDISVSDQSLNFRFEVFGREMDFQVIFGIHSLLRNNMKRLEGTEIRVWLLVQKVSPFAVRYHTIIKSGDDWCAFTGNNSNMLIFKEALA